MAVQAYLDPMERGHLLGDVPALLLVAVVPFVLTPRKSELERAAAPPDAEPEGAEPATPRASGPTTP